MDADRIRRLMEDQLKHSRRLQARIHELEDARHAPLAVVGMALRLPGGLDSPEAYWDFLRGTGTAYRPIPDDRPGLRAVYDPVPGTPGRSYVDKAGFLDDIAHFDADFFGISQREARLLDPQQRMLLETAWEALERAGLPVRRAERRSVGVYLGMMASEYLERLEDRADTTGIDPYYTTGGGLCFGAGRISHVMGFSGPVLSVDTACSSSLSALHLAARGLRAEECRYALVCGANLLLSANLMVSLSQTRALSPAGRSKSFLASADGYGRGEGVGVLVLMRLADAEREGRPILAVVRGTAVNHDGAASGLTAPHGPAQQEVIRAALADARVDPADLGWIEAHGTGTPLGDPIEVGALDGVVGAAVRERGFPLPIGSVKSRLGHLEAASGIAALIKTVLMLQHGEIPAAAADDDGPLNPHIPWDAMGFTVPRHNQPWPERLPRRIAGVNSFGMSGTNAHAVLAAYPLNGSGPSGEFGGSGRAARVGAGQPLPGARQELLTVSAKDPAALRTLAERLAVRLRKGDPAAMSSVCHTMRCGRSAQPIRLAVTGGTAAELAEELAVAVRELTATERAAERAAATVSAGTGGAEAARVRTAAIPAARAAGTVNSGAPTAATPSEAAMSPVVATRPGRVPGSFALVLGGDGQRVDSALHAWAQAFPALAETATGTGAAVTEEQTVAPGVPAVEGPAAVTSATPANRLAALLAGLGLRVAVQQDSAGADPVRLSWRSGDTVRSLPLVGDDPGAAPALLLAALAVLFAAGADLRLERLRGPDAVLLGDLPTYPFRRRRFWIDEPPMGAAREGRAPTGTAAVPEAPRPADTAAVAAFLLRELQEVLQADEPLDPERSFLDGGGDSFLSTLFITRVEEHYRLRLTAEDLPLDLPLSELLGSLARDITDTAPAEPVGEVL